jgi:prepilin-type processing-associated H-X9-DG protein
MNGSSVDNATPRRNGCSSAIPFSPTFVVMLVMLGMYGCPAVISEVRSKIEASRQPMCVANLRQIGVAMQAYEAKCGCYPPAFLPDKNGKPQHSWRVLILPFLGQQKLYAKYRFDEPWDSPHNAALAPQMPAVFGCPSQRANCMKTGYAMLVGPHAITDGPTPRRKCDIKGKLKNTAIVAEAGLEDIPWMEPRDLDTTKMTFEINATTRTPREDTSVEISSCHPGKANVLFCDGSVRTLSSDSVNPKQLQTLTTVDGEVPVPAER